MTQAIDQSSASVAALLAIMPVGWCSAGAGPSRCAPGTVGGKATDEAKKPYSDYAVQLRDVSNGQVANTKALDLQGQFSFLRRRVPQTI